MPIKRVSFLPFICKMRVKNAVRKIRIGLPFPPPDF
jgi:hypothetical protein